MKGTNLLFDQFNLTINLISIIWLIVNYVFVNEVLLGDSSDITS